MIHTAIAAALLLAAAQPALAQDGHVNHAAHGHQHAAFASDRIHVAVEGQGPDVIFIPGLSSSPAVWQGTVDHLNGAYRVHRIHVQGFAGAPAEGNATGPVAAPVAEEIAPSCSNWIIAAFSAWHIPKSSALTINNLVSRPYPNRSASVICLPPPFSQIAFSAPGIKRLHNS